MINKLYIKDFAILNEINLSFQNGLTVITGETGSGKSILLQALNVSLGGKTSKTMVKSDAERAVVETRYNSNTYRRVINKSGRTKSFINEEPLIESDFRNECYSLVDFHGQHEQQFIMNEVSHIDYLDAFCGISDQVKNCTKLFVTINNDEKELFDLLEKKQNAEQQQELLNFQLNEITAINPIQDEDIELDKEISTLKHFDEIVETANRLAMELSNDDESVYNRISTALFALEKISDYDKELADFSKILKSASVNVQETSSGLSEYVNSLNHDKERMVEIQDRLGAIDNLKRKYGGTIESILATKSQIEERLNGFSSLSVEIEKIKSKISTTKSAYQKLSEKLHKIRINGSTKLSAAVESEMLHLNMQDAKFEIHISQKEVSESFIKFNSKLVAAKEKGFDNVRFLLSANPGEQLKPLVEIASGGEISRIMLAIKTVFQQNDPVDTLIFDEIDSGISGSAAEKVAKSLANLAKSKQVICITHLPQIAQSAMHHLHISKSIINGQTFVSANYLNENASKDVLKQFAESDQLFNQ